MGRVRHRSPKLGDRQRDGRYSFHTTGSEDVDDEFMVSGRARNAEDDGVRDPVYAAYVATGAHTGDNTLFELLIDGALHAEYGPRPSWPPDYRRWSATAPTV